MALKLFNRIQALEAIPHRTAVEHQEMKIDYVKLMNLIMPYASAYHQSGVNFRMVIVDSAGKPLPTAKTIFTRTTAHMSLSGFQSVDHTHVFRGAGPFQIKAAPGYVNLEIKVTDPNCYTKDFSFAPGTSGMNFSQFLLLYHDRSLPLTTNAVRIKLMKILPMPKLIHPHKLTLSYTNGGAAVVADLSVWKKGTVTTARVPDIFRWKKGDGIFIAAVPTLKSARGAQIHAGYLNGARAAGVTLRSNDPGTDFRQAFPTGGSSAATTDMKLLMLAPKSGYTPTLTVGKRRSLNDIYYFYLRVGKDYGKGSVTLEWRRNSHPKTLRFTFRLFLNPTGSRNVNTRTPPGGTPNPAEQAWVKTILEQTKIAKEKAAAAKKKSEEEAKQNGQ
ncbi:MAG: hypothetical protein ACP5O1_10905 [Phycisphaerae bacterium]